MTALAQKATQFPKNRVLGQAGILDSARFTNFVAEALNVPVKSVKTLTLGSHGDTMVPVPSKSTVDGKPLREVMPDEQIEDLVVRTRNGGAEVVALLKTGSAYYAPSAAAARMAKAVAEDSGDIMRSAPGSTASTASPASTWASRPRSAGTASSGSSRPTWTPTSWPA